MVEYGLLADSGLLEELEVDAEELLRHAPRIFSVASAVRRLRVCNAKDFIGKLAQLEGLDRVEAVSLRGCGLSDDHVVQLSPRLGRLRSLDLSDNAIGDFGVLVLADANDEPLLESLNLSHNRLSEACILSLGSARRCRRLRSLALGGNRIGGPPPHVRTAPMFGNLESLDLSANGLDAAYVEQSFLLRDALPTLTSLDLSGNDIGDEMRESLKLRFGEGVRF